jgi:alkylhydroperoxidase/carboxymuconolactone decarboxylase family protein YurZ
MANQQTTAQQMIGDFAPKLVELTDEVLFGDIWERPGLSKRDRSLVTGWPNAMTAITTLKTIIEQAEASPKTSA